MLYLKSGPLAEYNHDYGVGFTEDTFEQALERMRDEYAGIKKRIATYPHTSERMTQAFLDLFLDVHAHKNTYALPNRILAYTTLYRHLFTLTLQHGYMNFKRLVVKLLRILKLK